MTATQQWDALLEVAQDWAKLDRHGGDEPEETEEEEEPFIDDDPPEGYVGLLPRCQRKSRSWLTLDFVQLCGRVGAARGRAG